jgi:hypothetical protein
MSLLNYALQQYGEPGYVPGAQPSGQNVPGVGATVQQITQFNFIDNFGYLVITLIALAGIISLIVIIYRYYQIETAYVGTGKRIPNRHRFWIPNYGQFDAWVTRADHVTSIEKFNLLKTIPQIEGKPELVRTINSIIEKIKAGKLLCYEIKKIDRKWIMKRGKTSTLGYAFMVSTLPLEDSRNYREIQGGVFTPASPRMKEDLRYISCHPDSFKFEGEDVDRKPTEIFVIAPMTYPDREVERITPTETIYKKVDWGQGLEVEGMRPYEIHTSFFTMPESMTELLMIAHMVADLRKLALTKELEAQSLDKMLKETQKSMLATKYENNYLKHQLGQQALIKLGEEIIKKEVSYSWGWILMFIIGTYVGMNLPAYVPHLSTMNPFFGVAMVDGPLAMIKWYIEDKQKSQYDNMKKKVGEEGKIEQSQ